jgi:hypothetical protein
MLFIHFRDQIPGTTAIGSADSHILAYSFLSVLIFTAVVLCCTITAAANQKIVISPHNCGRL